MSERVDNSSDIPTLKEVIDELGIFERWYRLGICLKLDNQVLRAINVDGRNTEIRCINMVEKWLDSKTNPLWGELCKALQDMSEHALADRIARKYCPEMCTRPQQPKPAIPCEQQPRATCSNDRLMEYQLPQVPEDDDDASKRKSFEVAVEFAFMFATVVKLLETTDFEVLKTFLESLCDPRTELPFVSPKLYEHCMTTAEVLKSLRPQSINSMHLGLLKKIVDKFGCDKAKELVRQYDTNFPREIPLKRLGDPLTDEEIEACIGTKKLKVVIDRDPNGVTKRDIEVYQGVIVRNTEIPPQVIMYAKCTPGSVVLMFLIPEGTAEIFTNLTRNDLLFLAGSGIIRIELNDHVIDVLTGRCKMAESMTQELVKHKVDLNEGEFPSSLPETAPFDRVTYVLTTNEPQHETAPNLYSPTWSESEDEAFRLAKKIYSNKTEDTLRLDSKCDQGGLAMLAGALCVNCSVKEIDLTWNCKISDEGAGVLAGCLHVNQTLEKLDLVITELSNMCRGLAALADGLCDNRGLRKLDLSVNEEISDECIGMLTGFLHVNQTLEKLNLMIAKLSDKGMTALADGLCNNKGLRELDLCWNRGMPDEGIDALGGCLHVNQTLEKLSLCETNLSDRGVVALADGLCNNIGLRELDLSLNYISDESIGVFAGCLHVNQTLEKLDLSCTMMSDRGVAALADGLCNNTGLRELDLSENSGISDVGIGVLAGCLHVNQTLEKLNLCETSLSDKGVAALADGLCNNRGLRELELPRNVSVNIRRLEDMAREKKELMIRYY